MVCLSTKREPVWSRRVSNGNRFSIPSGTTHRRWCPFRSRLLQRGTSMTKEQSFVSADHIDLDPFISSQTQERTLNAAIVQANISESFEEYLEIFDAFYADDIEASSETGEEPVRGKARVRSLLFNFLVPLHVMAEVGGLSISIRETAIPGDIAGET